ncbi:hypothetical protein ACFVRU_53700, partial [Streptomyces sp. NPDC057927]
PVRAVARRALGTGHGEGAPDGSAPRRSAGLPGHTWPSTRRMAAAEGAMRTANAVTLRAPRIARVHWGASAA